MNEEKKPEKVKSLNEMLNEALDEVLVSTEEEFYELLRKENMKEEGIAKIWAGRPEGPWTKKSLLRAAKGCKEKFPKYFGRTKC